MTAPAGSPSRVLKFSYADAVLQTQAKKLADAFRNKMLQGHEVTVQPEIDVDGNQVQPGMVIHSGFESPVRSTRNQRAVSVDFSIVGPEPPVSRRDSLISRLSSRKLLGERPLSSSVDGTVDTRRVYQPSTVGIPVRPTSRSRPASALSGRSTTPESSRRASSRSPNSSRPMTLRSNPRPSSARMVTPSCHVTGETIDRSVRPASALSRRSTLSGISGLDRSLHELDGRLTNLPPRPPSPSFERRGSTASLVEGVHSQPSRPPVRVRSDPRLKRLRENDEPQWR